MEYFSPPRELVTDVDTLLLDAVQYSNSGMVLEGIIYGDNYVNVNIKNKNKETPLIIAVKRNDIEFVEILLKNKNTLVNTQDINGDTALHIAIRNYYYEIAKLLLYDWRTDINVFNKNLETIVHLVCFRGEPVLYKLLEGYRDFDVTRRDILGYTPFMYCMLKPDKYIIDSLLDRNAIVEVPNILDDIGEGWKWFINHHSFNINNNIKEDQTLFGYCCYKNDLFLLQELFKNGLFVPNNLSSNIELALKGDNIQFILELLKLTSQNLDTNIINLLFLHTYDESGLIIILDYLLSIDLIDISYIVFQSISNKRLDVLEQYLLCCPKNIHDIYGNTILNLAIQEDIPVRFIKKMLKIGTDPSIQNNLDKKPLYYAIEYKNVQYIELLLPVTKLIPEERVYILELNEYIKPELLLNIVPLDSLELFEVKHYNILMKLIDKVDKSTKKQLLFKILDKPEICVNLLVKIANVSLKDTHNTEDIFTLEEFNFSNKHSIIQYGKSIEGKYRTITLEALLKLLESIDNEYLMYVKDPFDRSKLFNKIVYTTGLPIFIDCIVRKLIK
jgi:ankyrin repeat protein